MGTSNNYKDAVNHDKLHTVYKSALVGALAGIVVVLYRIVLSKAEAICFLIYDFLRANIIYAPLAFIALGITGYLIGCLVSKYRMISGSGIPQLKGILMGYFKNNWLGTLIAKFIGGTICIIGGLSLGREGPSIQLGSCVGEGVAQKLGKTRYEKKVLIASGASAGLAAAFNAPLAGVMFCMEEIFKYFSPVVLLSTMLSAMIADFISKSVFGISAVFEFHAPNSIPLKSYWILILMGIILGFSGVIYNKLLLLGQKLYKKASFLTVKTRPIVAFIFAGIFGLTFPIVLAGGHKIVEELHLTTSITLILTILLFKFIFSMISFGSGAPGGIFFPLLVMGASIGAVCGKLAITYLGCDEILFYNFVILAMAGFFTAIVRAPITGVILLTEMTGSFTHLLSLSVVSFVAYIVADLLKSEPIYESLLENQLHNLGVHVDEVDHSRKLTFEAVVHYGSKIDGKMLKDISLPQGCLIISIRRCGKDFIPHGETVVKAEDLLIVLTSVSDEAASKTYFEEIICV